MKTIFVIIMLLASLLLASCENDTNNANNDNANVNNGNYSISRENTTQNQTERLTYKEYIEKYGEIDNEEENDVEQSENENFYTTNEIIDNSISSYSTPLLSSSEERTNNLEIVCDRLNNFILYPSQTFSYNEVAGPYGPSDGFEEATILLSDGTKSEGYGGGVCQLSSTLYNVVKNMENIEITERHNHSAPVAYVPEGQDATVSLQSGLDFKFVNNNDYAIRFEATCANGNVTVKAFKEG